MLAFLQSNLSLVLGAVLLLVVAGLRTTTGDRFFRHDMGAALRLLVAHFALRGLGALLPPQTPPLFGKLVAVGWMLALAWGAVRTAVSLALYFVRLRRGVDTPKILRDVLDFTLYALATVPILKTQLDFDLTGVVATSAVLSVIIGLALQDTLGNLFAGLSLQLEQPFEVGDWVAIGPHKGQVVQIGWRATRIQKFTREVITLPNNLVAKESVLNYSHDHGAVGVEELVNLPYETPPNLARQAFFDVIHALPGVLPEPPPTVRVRAQAEAGLSYQVRFWVANFDLTQEARDLFYTRLWYRLRREGIEQPAPRRTVYMQQAPAPEVSQDELFELLRRVDLFHALDPRGLEQVAAGGALRPFACGERIVREGEEGHTFYVVVEGTVAIRSERTGQEVARLERGQCFGEMSLLTGEPRAASVVALTDVVLLEMARPLFSRLFADYPEMARQLSAQLARRRSQLRAVTTSGGPAHEDSVPEANRIFGRLRQIFRLGE